MITHDDHDDMERMSREEKLRAMEALWQEISHEEPAPESPAWHEEALEQTRSRVAAGTEQTLDWGDAKRRLRQAD
ncbi:MAG: addiction module protein [Spirochaetaceae bacterium]